MPNGVLKKLKSIEHNLCSSKDYAYDPKSISIQEDSLNLEPLPLSGLKSLISDLTIILNGAYINQQSLLFDLSNDSKLNENINDFTVQTDLITIVDNSENSWDVLPSAEDDNNKLGFDLNETSFKSLVQLENKFQNFHNKALAILDAKLQSFEILQNCIEFYVQNLFEINQKENEVIYMNKLRDEIKLHFFLFVISSIF